MANLQEFHFSTGVKPYSHVPAVPVGNMNLLTATV